MNAKEHNANTTQVEENISKEGASFSKVFYALPVPLKNRVLQLILSSVAIAFATIIFIIVSKSWECILGFLFAVYIAYIGMSIVWKYEEGKILCKTVRCLSVTKVLGSKERLYIAVRTTGNDSRTEPEIMKFYLRVSKKDSALLKPDVILHIYMDRRNQAELIAWELIDVYRNA